MSLLLRALPYLVLLGVLAAAAWWLEDLGYERGRAELTEYIAEQATATAATQRVVEKIVHDVEVRYVDRVREVERKGNVIVQKVTEYVTKDDDMACRLRIGSLLIHDAAAQNSSPRSPSPTDREAGEVEVSSAMQTVAANYATCNRWREQVIGWQDFYDRLQRTTNSE